MSIVVIISLLLLVLWLWCAYRKNLRKVRYMLGAILDTDFNFKYPEEGVSPEDREVNRTLNQISRLIAQAQREAREQEKFYELILNSVNTGIIVIDERGNVLQTNAEAMRLLGLSVFTHVAQLSRIDSQLERTVMQAVPGEKQQASVQNERETRHLSLHTSTAALKGKQVRIIALNDINNELEEKEIDSWMRLTRVLTHEIMNTITPISSLSETLLEKADGELHSGLEAIRDTSRELMSFVEDYRKFTHLPTPAPTLFYVKDFCQRMARLAVQQIGSRPIALRVEVQPDDLILHADESLTARVVLNLLKNAVQAIGTEKGEIVIAARCDEQDAVLIDITNDGPLIPPEVAKNIFVPFFTTKKGGCGIGLSISRQIMRLGGGTLTLHTDTQRGTTTFRLRFP